MWRRGNPGAGSSYGGLKEFLRIVRNSLCESSSNLLFGCGSASTACGWTSTGLSLGWVEDGIECSQQAKVVVEREGCWLVWDWEGMFVFSQIVKDRTGWTGRMSILGRGTLETTVLFSSRNLVIRLIALIILAGLLYFMIDMKERNFWLDTRTEAGDPHFKSQGSSEKVLLSLRMV